MKIKFFFRETTFLLIAFLLFGCASVPGKTGAGDLCGFVVDEDSNPVKDCIVSCRKEKGLWKRTITDERGLFCFSELSFGKYEIVTEKNSYENSQVKEISFYDRSKIFCVQTKSIKKMADLIEENIICENYAEAKNLIGSIKIEEKSPEKRLLDFYEEYIKHMEDKNEI